jgi:predicted metal-dependent enzyme (double-stranded beta helix superfamily)
MSLSSEQLERFVRDLAARPEVWTAHVVRDARERAYVPIWDDEDVNAWLICWSADSDTGFHDHDASAASIAVLEGVIVDERLRIGTGTDARMHHAGATFNIAPTAIHRVTRAGDRTAVTIHAYSPPLKRTGAYRISPDGRLEREAQSGEAELCPLELRR